MCLRTKVGKIMTKVIGWIWLTGIGNIFYLTGEGLYVFNRG